MSSLYPISRLIFANNVAISISGPHIHVVDSITGRVLRTTTKSFDAEQRKSGPISCVAADQSLTYLATVAEDKALKVWSLVEGDPGDMKLLSKRWIPKKPTCIHFTSDSQTIVISDKFGDVFRYSIHPANPQSDFGARSKKADNPPVPKNSTVSHQSTSDGTLVLGHASLLTTFIFASDVTKSKADQYIITADRDEHIRVSWFPQGYTVESYCLGSEEFVSALHIPSSEPAILTSGGGDSALFIWSWMSGEPLHQIHIKSTTTPYIKVVLSTEERKRRRWKNTKDEARHKGSAEVENVDSIVSTEEPILAVNKISSVELNGSTLLVFSVVGGTALFFSVLPSSFPSEETTVVTPCDLEVPVIDFTIVDPARGLIWAILDSDDLTQRVKAVQVMYNESITVGVEQDDLHSALKAFNSEACTVEASVEELASLNLYDVLLSYPKDTDAENDTGSQNVSKKKTGKRQAGRMKKKTAVLELQQILNAKDGGDGERDRKKTRSVAESITGLV